MGGTGRELQDSAPARDRQRRRRGRSGGAQCDLAGQSHQHGRCADHGLGLLGINHRAVDGKDFMPLVRGEVESIYDHIVTGWSGYGETPSRAAVRTLEHAYSCDYQQQDLDEYLFDLKADFNETKNVASEHPEVVEQHRKWLEEFLGESLPGAPYPELFEAIAPAKIWWEKAEWAQGAKRK